MSHVYLQNVLYSIDYDGIIMINLVCALKEQVKLYMTKYHTQYYYHICGSGGIRIDVTTHVIHCILYIIYIKLRSMDTVYKKYSEQKDVLNEPWMGTPIFFEGHGFSDPDYAALLERVTCPQCWDSARVGGGVVRAIIFSALELQFSRKIIEACLFFKIWHLIKVN